MPVLVRRNSMNSLFVLDEPLARMFEQASECICGRKTESSADWQPTADMYETEETVIIHVELAGIDKTSLRIAFQKGHVIIQGNRPLNPEMQSARIHRMEQMYGTFERTFRIPTAVDIQQITAAYEFGILKITLPKQPEPSDQQAIIPITFTSS